MTRGECKSEAVGRACADSATLKDRDEAKDFTVLWNFDAVDAEVHDFEYGPTSATRTRGEGAGISARITEERLLAVMNELMKANMDDITNWQEETANNLKQMITRQDEQIYEWNDGKSIGIDS